MRFCHFAVAAGIGFGRLDAIQKLSQRLEEAPLELEDDPLFPPYYSQLRQQRTNLTALISELDTETVIQDMQSFIQQSRESFGFATLVLMGDSTVAGATSELLRLTEEIDRAAELVYVSNDRGRAVHYAGYVKPGGEWVNESSLTDDMATHTVKRAQASTEALHAKGCKSGGGLETYVYRSGPFKDLVVHHWGFLPEYTDFCWDSCMTDAMAALKPEAVMWNIGFHLLNHDFSPAVCSIRHNPTKKNCGNHKEMIKEGSRGMLNAGVRYVIWKHTNYLCEARQNNGFPATVEAMKKWHDEPQRPKLEEECKEACPDYSNNGLKCYDWFFDAHTTERFYKEANAAIADVEHEITSGELKGGSIHSLDAFQLTKSCCDKGCESETDDGEHYTGVDPHIMAHLASILGRRKWNA